jgi:hypothetical protein
VADNILQWRWIQWQGLKGFDDSAFDDLKKLDLDLSSNAMINHQIGAFDDIEIIANIK